MARIVCIANQKGGVGKTTTAVNLCAAIKEKRRKVLLIDSDPQGNATTGLGLDKQEGATLYDVLIQNTPVQEAIRRTKYGDVLPTNLNLSGAEVELVEAPEREQVLKKALAPVGEDYEYILIDCPPSLSLLTLNALAAADGVLIPVQCEFYAMEGLTDLITSMRLTKRSINPALKIEGIVLTMYDKRLTFSSQVAREVENYFGKAVFETIIPRNVRIAEAPSHGKPVVAYNRLSKGATAYDSLAVEFFKHIHVTDL
ncbi:MAG: ParA family protein [Oscillospiraceae bacterium]|nr:ParA family protein [Oscillospiraceae bacterium]